MQVNIMMNKKVVCKEFKEVMALVILLLIN